MIKGLFRLILFLFLLLVLGLIFAPQLISTKFGKAAFFKIYRSITGNILTVENMDLSWWKGQSLENISWSNPSKTILLQVGSAQTTASLWQVLFYNDLGDLLVTDPKAVISTDVPSEQRMSSISAGALRADRTCRSPGYTIAGFIPSIAITSWKNSFAIPYYGQISLKGGEIQCIGKGLAPIDLKNISLQASLLKSQIKLSGSGTTCQERVEGHFDLSLLYIPKQSQIDLLAKLDHFPVRGLDQTLLSQSSLQGALLASLGEAINIELRLNNLPQTLEFYCLATSPSFFAKFETKTEGNKVTLTSPATIEFQVPQGVFQKLTSLKLNEPFRGDLKIDNFSMPLENKESFSFQATLHGEACHLLENGIPPFSLLLATENFQNRNFTVKIDSPQLQLNSSLHLPDPWYQLTLNGEALFQGSTHIDFSAQTLSTITAHVQGDLYKGAAVASFDPLSKTVKAQLNADPFHLEGIPLDAVALSLVGNLQTLKGDFQFTSRVDQGSVAAKGSFEGLKQITAQILLSHIPVALASPFLKNPPPLPVLIGPFVEGNIDLDLQPEKQQITLQLSSQNLTAKSSLLYLNSTLSITKPTQITWTITPEGYAALDQWLNKTPTHLTLTAPTTLNIALPSLVIPYQNLPQMAYQVEIAIDKLAFSGTELDQIRLSLAHPSARDANRGPLDFQFIAKGSPTGSASVTGSFDLVTGSTQFKSRLDQFPTEALDIISHALGKTDFSFSALLGPYMNLTASASLTDWNGPLQMELNTPQIRSSLNGTVTGGVLTLNEMFHLQMVLNRDLSGALLKSLNPLSLSTFSSEAPITLQIPPQGVSYPLYPFDDAKMTIPSGRLELGKITCYNEGNINATLGLLKLSQYSQNQNLELWFAPLDFHMNEGILECERTEILLGGAYQICTWGAIDFVSRYVKMILGLTASCLKKAFGIEDLPSSYVLQIPMKGPLNDVKIDSSKATSKVTTLLLWQQKSLAGSIAGGKAGALLGKFVNKAIPLPDGNAKAPPPKHPFPWEPSTTPKNKKTSSAESKKKRLNPDEAPLKQALQLLR